MFSNQSAELSLAAPARTVASVDGDRRHHRFLVGTCSLPRPDYDDDEDHNGGDGEGGSANRLHLLRFEEESNELGRDAALDHPTGEVWCCSSCPYDSGLVLTCGGNDGGTTTLWRIPEEIITKDDEFDYPDLDEEGSGGGGGANSGAHDKNDVERMEEVCTLPVGEMHGGGTSSSSSGGAPGGNRIGCALWNPASSDLDDFGDDPASSSTGMSARADVLTVGWEDGVLTRWDLAGGSATEVDRIDPSSKSDSLRGRAAVGALPHRAAWDPHDPNLVASALGSGVAIHDLRTGGGPDIGLGGRGGGGSTSRVGVRSCHAFGVVTDLDYNPNKPRCLVTSGQDGLVKFWDLRSTSSSSAASESSQRPRSRRAKPLKVLRGGHTHWTTRVRYNKFHDQLVLSGGTDSVVNLWRASSVSSAPLLELDGADDIVGLSSASFDASDPFGTGGGGGDGLGGGAGDGENRGSGAGGGSDVGGENGGSGSPDVRVSRFENPDAVYDLTWSAADAWVFVSVSYEGSVVLNHVPSKEKYKILL